MIIIQRASILLKLFTNNSRNKILSSILLVSLLASCMPGGSASSSIEPPSSIEAASPEQTAAWLENPDDVKRGVWSLLKNLGIGVYTQEGEQILAGSERSAEDLFLFDFEVSLLISRGQQSSKPFSDYYQMLVPYGLTLTEEELKDFYQGTYQAHADEWLAQLFQSMDLDFEGDVHLSPLQEWLLFLDTFVPPTGKETAVIPASSRGLMALVPPQQEQNKFCDAVRGNNADTAWGLAWAAVGTASDAAATVGEAAKKGSLGVMSFLDPKDILHAIMMMMGVETKIEKTASSAHENHDGQPDQVIFTVSVEFTGDLPAEIVSCAAILGFDVPKKGPIEGARVEWDLGSVLSEHGFSRKGAGATAVFTDPKGKSEAIWEARQEPSAGAGTEYEEDGTVEAVVRIQHGDVFNFFAGLQEFIMPRTETATISVGWHESDWILVMSINIEEQITGGILSANYTWDGRFSVDEDNNLQGEGTVNVTGSIYFPDLDKAEGMDCPPAELNGGFPFVIGGEQALESYAQVFKFDISTSQGGVFVESGGDQVCQVLKERISNGVVNDFIYNIMDYVPLGRIWVEVKDGETTEIRPAEGSLEVSVFSSR